MKNIIIVILRCAALGWVCYFIYDLVGALTATSSGLPWGIEEMQVMMAEGRFQAASQCLIRIALGVVFYLLAPLLSRLATVGTDLK